MPKKTTSYLLRDLNYKVNIGINRLKLPPYGGLSTRESWEHGKSLHKTVFNL